MDIYSDQAREDFANFWERHNLGEAAGALDADEAHSTLLCLTEQVLSWNRRLNLVSRKDCTAAVVYHRHVLPSVALLPLVLRSRPPPPADDDDGNNAQGPQLHIVDVGTGGGFPGLPLALLLPSASFTLVDSVRKKLVAVSDMAAELEAENVRVHWGRVEEMHLPAHDAQDEDGGGKKQEHHRGRYDLVLGRSVAALPTFCAWVDPLLKKAAKEGDDREEGKLVYIIGGELDDLVTSRVSGDEPLDGLLGRAAATSDKRALTIRARDVAALARESGEKLPLRVAPRPGKNDGKNKVRRKKDKLARGAWGKRQSGVRKQRGYDDFQRFES